MKNRISIVKGDITKYKAEAIVNAANTSLLGGGGVDGAIHKAAGPQLVEECSKLNGCAVGEAKITSGYRLYALHVIHAVGPIWVGGHRDEHALLASAYRNSLELANKNDLKSIAFPNISTGAYRFPLDQAANIAVTEVKRYLEKHSEPQEVIFVVFTEENFNIYNNLLADE